MPRRARMIWGWPVSSPEAMNSPRIAAGSVHVLDVDHHVLEVAREVARLDPDVGAGVQDVETQLLEGGVGCRQGVQEDDLGDHVGYQGEQHDGQQPPDRDSGGLEGGDSAVRGQAPEGHQDGQQNAHGDRQDDQVGQAEEKQLAHRPAAHPLGEQQVEHAGQGVGQNHEGEDEEAEGERGAHLAQHVAVEDPHGAGLAAGEGVSNGPGSALETGVASGAGPALRRTSSMIGASSVPVTWPSSMAVLSRSITGLIALGRSSPRKPRLRNRAEPSRSTGLGGLVVARVDLEHDVGAHPVGQPAGDGIAVAGQRPGTQQTRQDQRGGGRRQTAERRPAAPAGRGQVGPSREPGAPGRDGLG